MDYVELIPSEDLLYGRRRGYVKVIIAPSPSDAVVTLIAEGFNQTGNFIYVPVGTEVTYTVMKNGYFISSGTTIADITKVVRVTLQEKPRNIWYAWDSGETEEWSSPVQVGTVKWNDVVYGNNKFVAVGDSAYVATSSDGISWSVTREDPSILGDLVGVTYVNGTFVLVSSTGSAKVSTDGINWQGLYSLGVSSNGCSDVTSGNGKFVAVDKVGWISYSTTGTSWLSSKVNNKAWRSVTYGNGVYIAVGEDGYYMTSSDGVQWTDPVQVGTSDWYSVAYGSGKFMAVGEDGYYMTSSDGGETWSVPAQMGPDPMFDVTYGNGNFAMAQTSNWSCIGYGKGTFVIMGGNGTIGYASYRQIQSVRTQVEFPVIGDSVFDRGQERLGDIINIYDRYAWVYQRGDNVYTAYSSTISPAVGTKLMSDVDGDIDFIIDGSTTNLTVSETGYKKLKIAEFSDFSELDRFPSKDTTTSIKFPSKDLNNWSGWTGLDIPSSSGGTAGSKSVAYGGGKYVIVNSYTFSYSLDGENWVTEASLPHIPSGSYVSVEYLYGNKFIAISNTGYVAIGTFSSSGVLSFLLLTSSSLGNRSWVSVACNRDQNKLVALGEGGYLSLGTFDLNGNITWNTESSARLGSHNWQVIAYGNGKFVALGQAGYVSVGSYNSSSDVWTWSNPTINSTLSSAEMSYVGLTYGNNKFVTAFSGYSYVNGIKISTSLDGATWTALSSPSSLYGSTPRNIIYDDSKFIITNLYGSANYSVKVFSRNTSEDEEYLYTNFYLSANLLSSSAVTITFENENNVVTFPSPIDIDWGDGTTERINDIATITHTYPSEFSGAQIKITSSSGDLPSIIGSTNVVSCDSVLLPFVGPDGQTPVAKCKLFTSDFRNVCSSPFKQSSFSSLYSVFSNSQIKSIALRDMQEMNSNRTKGIARNSSITNADFSKTLLIDNSGLEQGFIQSSISNADFSNLLTAGEKAFSNAFTSYYNNSSIVFPLLESAGKQAFWIAFNGNSHLTDVKFPSLKSAGDSTFKHTFYGDTALTSVDFSSLESISGNETFSEAFCNTPLSSISFPSLKVLSGSNIFEEAFRLASSLTSISFPVLENASPYAFYICGPLSSVFNSINFKRLKEAEDYSFIIAFERCGIQKADFGRLEKAATSAFDTTFNDCPLTEIDLISLRELTGDYVFNGAFSNTSIRDIYLPSLKSIDSESAYVLHGILDGTTNCVLHLPQDLLVNPNTNFSGYGASNPTVLFDLFLRPDLEANGTLGDTTSPFAVSSPTITDVYKAFNSDYETYITKTTDNTEYVTMYSSIPINLIKLRGFTDFSDEVGVVSVQGSNDNATWTDIYSKTGWTTPIQIGDSIKWYSVAYGNNKFITMGADGYMTSSTDGITWTTPTQVGSNYWYSVTYGNNKFIAMGADGYMTSSTDGNTWTTPVQVGISNWYNITYGNGKFVAVGDNGYTSTSTDGVTWTTPVQVDSRAWLGVTYGNSKFVAVGISGYISTSTDGVTWTTPVQVGTRYWQSVTYGNGKFLVVGRDGCMTSSTDGSTWTTPAQVGSNFWYSVTYGNGKFVAVGENGYTSTSTDGTIWTTPVKVNSYTWSSVTYGNSKFVAVGYVPTSTGYASTYISVNEGETLLDGLNLNNLAYFNYYKVGLSGSTGARLNEIKLVAIEDAEVPLNVIEPLINEVLEIDYITGDYTDYSYEQAVEDIDDILEI